MSKIGIMTTYNSFYANYGAALQGYALQKQLYLLGHEAHVIRYAGTEWSPENNTIKDRIRWITTGGHYRDKILQYLNRPKRNLNREFFKKFVEEYIPFESSKSKTFDELRDNPPAYDAFICGSDQVWNPIIHQGKNDPGYFLDFAPTNAKRIAYAPSFGISTLPSESKLNLGYYLDKFDAISVREQTGAQLIKDVTGKDVDVVIDPTMLLSADEWEQLAVLPDNVPSEYILVYKFGRVESTNRFIKKIAKKYKLPVISLPPSPTIWTDGYPIRFDVGPKEFIGLIKNAKIVCTDSFHATVFSILMNTPFLTFYRSMPSSEGNMNSRVEDLLALANLSSRLITPHGSLPENSLFEVDFSKANSA